MNIDNIYKFLITKTDEGYAYDMGYDCGLNGTNETNCHFSIFSSPENTKAWEQGKKDGEEAKLKTLKQKKVWRQNQLPFLIPKK